jgi:hypothetical protein
MRINMNGNKLPEFESIEELIEFFDTHDISEYFDEMPPGTLNSVLKQAQLKE